MFHRDVVDGDVFDDGAVHAFDRQSIAMHEHTIRNRDVLESAV